MVIKDIFKFKCSGRVYWIVKYNGNNYQCYEDENGKKSFYGTFYTGDQIKEKLKSGAWVLSPDKWDKYKERMLNG